MFSVFVFLKAICGKSKPCLNGGSCESSTGTCNCASHSFVGDFCHVPVGKEIATFPCNPLTAAEEILPYGILCLFHLSSFRNTLIGLCMKLLHYPG